jgi:hypothetical protein
MAGPTTAHYRVFLNDTHMSRFFQLERGAELRLAYAAQVEVEPDDGDMRILNRLYQLFNIEHPDNYMNRSLSVADVVTVFRRGDDCKYSQPYSYVVQPVGFLQLDVVILNDCVYAGRTISADAELAMVKPGDRWCNDRAVFGHALECTDFTCFGCRPAAEARQALDAVTGPQAQPNSLDGER